MEPSGPPSKWIGRTLVGVLAAFALLSLDHRPAWQPAPPEVVHALRVEGSLHAGAALVDLTPPFPVPMGGYNTRGSAPHEGVLDPPAARAVVLEVEGRRVALVSAELVVLPGSLRRAVLREVADLSLDEVVIAATHTHASIGGYWDHPLARWVGLGPYDPQVERFLVERLAESIRAADERRVPARIAAGRIEASNFGAHRHRPGAEVDRLLTASRVEDLEGHVLVRLVVLGVHPTILHRDSMQLGGDWPGSLMRSFEAEGAPCLFLQGALGDVTWAKRQGAMTLPERAQRFGLAVAADARGALVAGGDAVEPVALATARVKVRLPPADAGGMVPFPFRGLVSNLLHWLAGQEHGEVAYLQAGPLALALVPGEPVADLGRAWREQLGGATVVGLADDYLGYVETAERIRAREGEAVRSYFGADLAAVLKEGLLVARDAAHNAPPPAEPVADR